MRIIKKGTVVRFNCSMCGCEFVVGIRNAHTPDKGENYYIFCPVCGDNCHADVNDKVEKGVDSNAANG